MAITRAYNNGNCVGLTGNDIPARIFCKKCGELMNSSLYEPEKGVLCSQCSGQHETTLQESLDELGMLFKRG